MTKLKTLITRRLFWAFVGAVLLGLVIWFVGPLIGLRGWLLRLPVALLPIVIVALLWWIGSRRAARRNAALVDALAPGAAARHDTGEMAGKLTEALATLRGMKLGGRGAYLYELPWYAIIGPSKAGKTTALLNAGLAFPTALAGEYKAMRGQPNTPNCDWWFTDQAVLIDTAGRFVTQDAGADDADAWRGFLDLLKRHRPLQPLNGVLVAIPAPDLADPRLLESHIAHVRARLAEIGQSLTQKLPIYVLVTKADLLLGFREFFARADDDEAAQVLGSSAPDPALAADAAGVAIMSGFDRLIDAVGARVIDRIQAEPQLPFRAQIAAFPGQLAALRKPIARVLESLGQKTRFEEGARIRGVYLTSGTQAGNPVDRILMAQGVPPAPAFAVGIGRSYFLKRLFMDLVIPEAGLAGHNPAAERRSRLIYTGGIAASLVAATLLIGVWVWGYARNAALIDTVNQMAAQYRARAGGPDAAPEQQLAAMNLLGDGAGRLESASDFGLGLGQGHRLAAGVQGLYERDLQRRLAPMLAALAQRRLTADVAAPAALYDDLKSYLILGGQGPTLIQHVATWAQGAWALDGGPGSETQAGSVARHTQAMLTAGLHPIAIDAAQVEAAREILRAQPPAVRVYGRLKSQALAAGTPLWTAREHAGSQPELFFDPGGSMAAAVGVPQLFTRTGYERTFLPMLAQGSALLREEKWVVGDGGTALSSSAMQSMKGDLKRLYFDDFARRWQTYLEGLKPRPVSSLRDTVLRLRGGSGPLSPLPLLFRAIAAATDLTPRAGKAALPQPGGMMGAAAGMLGLSQGVGGGGDDGRSRVVAQFAPLRAFVGAAATAGQPGSAPIDAMMTTMAQLADKLTTVEAMAGSAGGDQGSPTAIEAKALIAQLDQTAQGMPAPVAGIARQVSGDAGAALTGERRNQLSSALGASFGDACRRALSGKYPVRDAAADVTLDDFTRLFAPNAGAFAQFAQRNAGAIDMTGAAWQPTAAASELGLTDADVAAFQSAQSIGRIFFNVDQTRPQLSFQIEPVGLTGAKQVTLMLGAQTLTFTSTDRGTATADWPGAGGASVEFARDGSAPVTKSWPGVWAAFRLMQAAGIRGENSPVADGRLDLGGASFQFRVRTLGVANPFGRALLGRVQCPASQVTGQVTGQLTAQA